MKNSEEYEDDMKNNTLRDLQNSSYPTKANFNKKQGNILDV